MSDKVDVTYESYYNFMGDCNMVKKMEARVKTEDFVNLKCRMMSISWGGEVSVFERGHRENCILNELDPEQHLKSNTIK